jgi:ankyrin repeat protein
MNTKNPQNELYEAIRHGNLDLVRRLLRDPRVDPTQHEQYALLYAIDHTPISAERLEILQTLLDDPRVDPAAYDNKAIQQASIYGRAPSVALLLRDPRVDPSAKNQAPIRYASYHGKTEVVRLLLADPRVDPSADNQFALRMACVNGYVHADVVRMLLADPRVDPSVDNQYALEHATQGRHVDIVRILLQDPRVKMNATVFRNMERGEYMPEITEMLRRAALQQRGRNIRGLRLASNRQTSFKNLPPNVTSYLGTMLTGRVGPTPKSQSNQLQANFVRRRKTRKYRKHRA